MKVIVIDNLTDCVLFDQPVSATWQLPNKSDTIVIDNISYDIVNIYHWLLERNITIYVTQGDN